MGDALRREMERQQGYRNEALGAFQPGTTQRGAETAETQIQQGAQHRQGLYDTVGSAQFGTKPAATARDQASYKLKGMARARLGGYSDWALDQMIANIRVQDQLNKISNFAGGTAQVFPYRMFDAQHSADDLAMVGGLISSIGGSAPAWGQMFGSAPKTGSAGGIGVPSNFSSSFAGQV